MIVTEMPLSGVLMIKPKRFGDDRGFFIESFNERRYQTLAGIQYTFVQDNWSRSQYGVLRGLHYQLQHTQAKLVWVSQGEILDVILDVRRGSPQFGRHICVSLKASEGKQLFIPPGFAHGFCTLSQTADFHYKCTDYYDPDSELSVLWNDPKLNIAWPIDEPIVSKKDQAGIPLAELSNAQLPPYVETQ